MTPQPHIAYSIHTPDIKMSNFDTAKLSDKLRNKLYIKIIISAV